jgi:hypothetical protein
VASGTRGSVIVAGQVFTAQQTAVKKKALRDELWTPGAESTYKFEPCQGYPSGYAGGIIASGRTCVQITVKTSGMKWATRLGFDGLRCPT